MEKQGFAKIAEMVEKIGNAFVGIQENVNQLKEQLHGIFNPDWFSFKLWIEDTQKELNEIEDAWSFLGKIPEIKEHMEE